MVNLTSVLFSVFADHGRRAIWIKQMIPLDMNFLIWLQCKWFECSLKETVDAISH